MPDFIEYSLRLELLVLLKFARPFGFWSFSSKFTQPMVSFLRIGEACDFYIETNPRGILLTFYVCMMNGFFKHLSNINNHECRTTPPKTFVTWVSCVSGVSFLGTHHHDDETRTALFSAFLQ